MFEYILKIILIVFTFLLVLFFVRDERLGNKLFSNREEPLINVSNDLLSERTYWLKNSLSNNDAFIDLSYLNDKPAGKHGFNNAVGDRFKFDNGIFIKFYGTNIEASTLFIKSKSLIKSHAKRIAKLGFNLVRLHHHDSPWVNPSLISNGSTTQTLNLKSLDSYFWWVKCLRDEGIYVWIDLQVQRPWRAGDQIPGWATDMESKAKKGMNVAKGFIYLNKKMQVLTKKFNTDFLTRINPYTQLALKDDPAVMGMMITNENDITHHFGNAFLKNKGHPHHQALFDEKIKVFSKKSGFLPHKLRETWKAGASKYLLNDIEARFNIDMIEHLRGLGVKVPITTTSLWGGSSLFSLPALTTGDMIDAHAYASSNIFKKNLLQKNPHFNFNFLHTIGLAQIVGKPITVSEYNVGKYSAFEHAYMPSIAMASMAAFQGWDAIMLYGYSHNGFKGRQISPWSSYNNPSIMGVMPAMALLYREEHVMQANKTVVLSPVNDELFTKKSSAKTSAAVRTVLEQHRLVVAMPKVKTLPWLLPSEISKNAIILQDINKNMLPAYQDFITSDTGEIQRNWRKGTLTVNTEKSQLVMGRIAGHIIKLNHVIIKSKTPEAVIAFTSLDKKSIGESKRILVSALARVSKTKVKGKEMFLSEAVNAEIILSSKHKGLRVIALLNDGREGKTLKVRNNKNGDYLFDLSEKDNTHWYVIAK